MEDTTITVVCFNCKKTIKIKDGKGVSGISHSVCEDCIHVVYGDVFSQEEINDILNEEVL
jgi:hypothetical protein